MHDIYDRHGIAKVSSIQRNDSPEMSEMANFPLIGGRSFVNSRRLLGDLYDSLFYSKPRAATLRKIPTVPSIHSPAAERSWTWWECGKGGGYWTVPMVPRLWILLAGRWTRWVRYGDLVDASLSVGMRWYPANSIVFRCGNRRRRPSQKTQIRFVMTRNIECVDTVTSVLVLRASIVIGCYYGHIVECSIDGIVPTTVHHAGPNAATGSWVWFGGRGAYFRDKRMEWRPFGMGSGN